MLDFILFGDLQCKDHKYETLKIQETDQECWHPKRNFKPHLN